MSFALSSTNQIGFSSFDPLSLQLLSAATRNRKWRLPNGSLRHTGHRAVPLRAGQLQGLFPFLKFLFTMEPLKYLEEFAVVPHIEATPLSRIKIPVRRLLGLHPISISAVGSAREFKSIRHKFSMTCRNMLGRQPLQANGLCPMNTPIASFRFQFLRTCSTMSFRSTGAL